MIDPMTGKTRALLVVLILLLVAAAASLVGAIRYQRYIAMKNASQPSLQVALANGNVAYSYTTDEQSELINTALKRLESSYYKPVDPSVPLDGERKDLLQFLRDEKIERPQLRGSDPNALLADAQARYASKLGSNGPTELTEVALTGIMDSVKDPYTVYLTPKEMRALTESLDGGDFGGIGVYIAQQSGLVIVEPIENLPAARAGMQPGEIVVSVGGKSISGMTLDAVEQLIRGEAGTVVSITTRRSKEGAEHHYSIKREIIQVPTVRAKMEDRIDYIRLSDFGKTSADEVKKALLDGKAKGAKGYILDLRDNGGGFLEAAVSISSFFVPKGTIVSTIDRWGGRDDSSADGDAIDGLQPLVILVNRYTASASEITAGALQDYHLATLIGEKTFGKGVVQSIYPMADNGALKITTARYVTPLGRDIQHKGIEPDIAVAQDANDPRLIDTPHDTQLIAAKAQLAKELRSEK